ncbi:MAG: TolC family protein [Muribaculaceae bacterium]|nr:TolC family protein [Muribaculaceae bacterium]
MRNKLIFALLLAAMSVSMQAQDTTAVSGGPWTLQQCIERAKQENLTLRRGRINVKQAEESVLDARDSRLPTVSFSSSQGLNYRPFRENAFSVNGSGASSSSRPS